MSAAKSGENHHLFGKTPSEFTREKMSEAQGTTIYLYDLNLEILKTFSSYRLAANWLKSNRSTIKKYAHYDPPTTKRKKEISFFFGR